MTDLTEMWTALESHQPIADRLGYGEAWKRMCVERTEEATFNASSVSACAAAYYGDLSADGYWSSAYKAANAAEGAVAYVAKAADWAKSAIEYTTRANKEAAK